MSEDEDGEYLCEDRKEHASINDSVKLDYTMDTIWYNDDIPASNELIFEEHIPFFLEEEVVAECVENENEVVLPSTNGRSQENTTFNNKLSESKQKNALTINRDSMKMNHRDIQNQNQKSGSHTPSSANFKPFVLNEYTMKVFKNKIKAIQKRRAQALAREKKQRPKKIKTIIHPPVSNKNSNQQSLSKKPHHHHHHYTQQHQQLAATTKKPEVLEYMQYKPKPSVDPKNSGEILRMEKVESDDIEVDILSNSEDDDNLDSVGTSQTIDLAIMPDEEDDDELSVDDPDSSFTTETMPVEQEEETLQKLNELKEYDEQTYNRIESNELPNSELILEPTNITTIEKFMMSEFFTASSTKTPERYLKIRNHIISMWNQCRPNYLSKTAARSGLKKCGDVNSISRVHLLLENIGAINFNCYEMKYILPLKVLYSAFQQSIRNKNQSYMRNKYDSNSDNSLANVDSSSDSMINRIKSRTQSRTQFELIKCQRFSKDNMAPFEISITLSCLLCLYFHALSSKLEIMGFLGGHVDKSNGRNKINLKCYKPCRTSTQTPISAEMCPVSQVEQSADLTESGYELLGWFHSHPSFPATPSRTDLRTQNEIQMQFAQNNPFVGLILSCLQPMDFKCIYMQKDTAYELQVDIEKDYSDFRKDIESISKLIDRGDNYEETVQRFISSGNNLLRELSIDDSIEQILQNEIF
ncbi:hypothetical protein PVAND_004307 [Polypedilum vanderplanki]|uniref:Myb-like, SWIRM and MPN domain-containing protein 1 n=1 Tax=Polypedilum vanderplanki TaxID=319348 RepID=A0A9J6BWR3_POLVA|nr:hypothetical protein PVAND_004307 [Polypedilum vanderplanki]